MDMHAGVYQAAAAAADGIAGPGQRGAARTPANLWQRDSVQFIRCPSLALPLPGLHVASRPRGRAALQQRPRQQQQGQQQQGQQAELQPALLQPAAAPAGATSPFTCSVAQLDDRPTDGPASPRRPAALLMPDDADAQATVVLSTAHTKGSSDGLKQQHTKGSSDGLKQQHSPLMLFERDVTVSGRRADPHSAWRGVLARLAWGLILPQQRVAWDLLLLLLLLWVAFAVPFILCFSVEVSTHGSTPCQLARQRASMPAAA
jgi:hypothetical protein